MQAFSKPGERNLRFNGRRPQRRWAVRAVFLLLLVVPGLLAAAEPNGPSSADDPRALAATIDEHLARRWQEADAVAAPDADDAEYLRRVYLDVAGKIPPAAEVRSFLNDETPDKRSHVVERLLDSPLYVVHFTSVWRAVMLPEASVDFQVRFLIPGFEAWLRERFAGDVTYDELVRELLTVSLEQPDQQQAMMNQAGPNPLAFYQAKEFKPENLAAGTARTFLGLRIDCAQCHDHPFDTWKQDQFWKFSAFYAGMDVRTSPNGPVAQPRNPTIAIPDTDQVVPASFLDGVAPVWANDSTPRHVLARWTTAPENPWFAKAAVNRLWAHFFGTGLVDPPDDFSEANPPSHPELLDLLATEFIRHDYDLKFVIRAITGTRAYQLTSRQTHESQEDRALYARMAVKGLTPEQLFDSLAEATGYYEPFQNRNPAIVGDDSVRSEFLEVFSETGESPTDRQTTILQALAMMNGQFVTTATGLENSNTLAAIAGFPLLGQAEQIEALYLAALSRPPRPDELERLVSYVESGGPTGDTGKSLGDVFWALLNSSEFLFNH